jgi:HAE1 family hydrophobic/amphiphilic exporter-1
MIRISIQKPITMLMVLMTLVVFGVYTYRMLAVDLMPDVALPIATVQVVYPGAGPEEVETSVVEKMEEGLSTLDGLDRLQVFIMEGVAVFVLEFGMKTDIDIAAMDIKDRIDATRPRLPSGIEDPVVAKIDLGAFPVMYLTLQGDDSPAAMRRKADKIVKPALTKIPGVAQANISGGLEREIQVELRRDELDARGLSLQQVFQVLAASNLNFPLGSLDGKYQDVTLRLDGSFTQLEELRQLEIPTMGGAVPLYQLANIRDHFKEVKEESYFNGTANISFALIKRSDANIVGVCDAIRSELPAIQKKLPDSYQLDVIKDDSRFIRNSLDDTFFNIYLGILLTAFILWLFLQQWATTLIAAITMPVTVIVTFTAIWISGFSLNIMTLMSLGLAVGLLVTNTIVVLENIMRHVQLKHDDPKEGAFRGTNEVATAVFSSALTNMAVFVPIAFMGSIVGKMFREFGLTMVYATLASLLISFTLTPMMASRLLGKKKKGASEDSDSETKEIGEGHHPHEHHAVPKGVLGSLQKVYGALLKALISWKGFALMIILLIGGIVLTGVLAKQLGNEFFPQTDEGLIDVKVEMPSGTNLQTTRLSVQEVEARIAKLPEVKQIFTLVGSTNPMQGGASAAKLSIQLNHYSERDRSTQEIVASLRPLLADIPGAQITMRAKESLGNSGEDKGDLDVQVSGPSAAAAGAGADYLQSYLDTLAGVASVRSSWKEGAPELVLRPRLDVLAEYGLVSGQVAQLIRLYVVGEKASVFREEKEEYDIRIRLAEEDRRNRSDILSMSVPTPRGVVPLSSLVEYRNATGPAQLNRLDEEPLVTLKVNLFPGITMGEVQAKLQEFADTHPLPEGAKLSFGGNAKMMAETQAEMSMAMIMAVLLTYILLTALLESFVQPLVIMMTIPLGAIGVIASLFVTGNTISMISMMAMVMLIGIVVNNGILIIDYANILYRHKGYNPFDAAFYAATGKFRAVVMTNVATVVSMLPLAMGLGEGAEMRQPMAIASIGGLVVSTMITVFLIPQLYWLLSKKRS